MSLNLPTQKNDELKIFISYSSKDYEAADKMHKMFNEVDIDCFLAGKDIKVGNRWNLEIFERLIESNFFILMLSENFLNSYWCNQEASIAFAQRKLNGAELIPISIDGTAPYGIFYDVHGIRYNDFDSIKKFIEIIDIDHKSFDEALEKHEQIELEKIEKLIDELRESKHYSDSNKIFDILKTKNVTAKHVDEIIEIALTNRQVLDSFGARTFLLKYFTKFEGQLNEKNVKKCREHWDLG